MALWESVLCGSSERSHATKRNVSTRASYARCGPLGMFCVSFDSDINACQHLFRGDQLETLSPYFGTNGFYVPSIKTMKLSDISVARFLQKSQVWDIQLPGKRQYISHLTSSLPRGILHPKRNLINSFTLIWRNYLAPWTGWTSW